MQWEKFLTNSELVMPIIYFLKLKFAFLIPLLWWLSCWKVMFCIHSAVLIQRSRNCFSECISLVWTVFRPLDSSVSGCILDSVFCQVPLTWLFKLSRGSTTSFAGSIFTVVYDFITPCFRKRRFLFSAFTRALSLKDLGFQFLPYIRELNL